METMRSYLCGQWVEDSASTVELVNPSTEEPVARLASGGGDPASALEYARSRGGPALRSLSFAERGELLRSLSSVIREAREELLEISRINTGTTEGGGAFDVDGGSYAFHYYGKLAGSLGGGYALPEDDGFPLSRSDGFWGRHLRVPRRGVAVHINAFNFPVWGLAEKVACALLAGMPVIAKPASATAWAAVHCVRRMVEAQLLPPGTLQLICGSPGDLLDRVGSQDVVAFTGSAETARLLRHQPHIAEANPRFNVEADSLNAAVLAPDATDGSVFDLFVRDVVREITQKAGQKCTAVRRILAPEGAVDRVEEALAEALGKVVTGNPEDPSVTMGPLATERQLQSALEAVAELSREADRVVGSGSRVDGVGSPAGKGYFLAPTLLRARGVAPGQAVHRREAFAPVATLLPYDGSPESAAQVVGMGGGMLVNSLYSNDEDWLAAYLREGGSHQGRLYIGSDASAEAAPGSGVAVPQSLHGGPGRAGGGSELGGLAGVHLYMERVALQGARSALDSLSEDPPLQG